MDMFCSRCAFLLSTISRKGGCPMPLEGALGICCGREAFIVDSVADHGRFVDAEVADGPPLF